MKKFLVWLQSSIGKKQVVGITGLGIAFFALMHMSGNMLMMVSPKAYNLYGHMQTHNAIFPLLELLLLAAFLFHVGFASWLWWTNRAARPHGNASAGSGPKRASFAARSMILTGLLLFCFIVLHLKTFKYGTYYPVIYDGLEVRDLYRLIYEKFQDPGYVGFYIFCLCVLFVHLSHGFSSMFQSLGIASARNSTLRKASWAFALIVAGGFISQPIWILCCGGK